MDWLHPLRPVGDLSTADRQLPKRLLRRVVRVGKIVIGSRVLDAGCGPGELTRFLDRLAVEAAGIDESPEQIAAAQSAAGHLDYSCCQASEHVPFPEQHFDVVLLRGLSEHRRDLCGYQALRATAHLLATLRPEGRLVVMRRFDAAHPAQSEQHQQACFAQHLTSFPGSCQVSFLGDSLLEVAAWKSIIRRRPQAGYMTAVLTVPQTVITCREWEQLALQAAVRQNDACCPWGEKSAESRQPSRIAA